MKKIIGLLLVAGALASCNPNAGKMDNSAANKALFQRFYDEVINAHNVDAIDQFVTADFVDHQPSPGHSGKGLDDLKAQFTEFMTAYPDINFKVDFMMASGDTVIAKVRLTGTNTGAMGDMPATGKSVDVEAVDIIVIKDGKATERWGYSEEMKWMTQMGMMPEPGAPPADASKKM